MSDHISGAPPSGAGRTGASGSAQDWLTKYRWKWWLLLGVAIGALLVLGLRFVLYSAAGHDTHYHANFALYINGQRETFNDPKYYEEVQICGMHGASPKSRVHMHDEENGVIHVHDAAVTWGDFFANLGWTLGPDFIADGSTIYRPENGNKMNLMLNGNDLTDVSSIANEVIGDKDRLLISYGPSDQAVLAQQFKSVPSTAGTYDSKPDPASCSGPEKPTAKERFEHLLK